MNTKEQSSIRTFINLFLLNFLKNKDNGGESWISWKQKHWILQWSLTNIQCREILY